MDATMSANGLSNSLPGPTSQRKALRPCRLGGRPLGAAVGLAALPRSPAQEAAAVTPGQAAPQRAPLTLPTRLRPGESRRSGAQGRAGRRTTVWLSFSLWLVKG